MDNYISNFNRKMKELCPLPSISLPAISTQEGGTHYKNMAIQPIEFCQMNTLNWCESNVVKYVCRHRNKNGAEDIRKAIHYLKILLELEYPNDKN